MNILLQIDEPVALGFLVVLVTKTIVYLAAIYAMEFRTAQNLKMSLKINVDRGTLVQERYG